MNYTFLEYETVLKIHTKIIQKTGGADGIKNNEMLLSAINMPQAHFGGEYLHKNIYEIGAAYLFHLCQNHPFIDGNKRIALLCCLVFLEQHSIIIDCSEQDLEDLVLETAKGFFSKAEIATFLEKHTVV